MAARFQMMETGDGRSPSWESHLNQQQQTDLENARQGVSVAGRFKNIALIGGAVQLGFLTTGVAVPLLGVAVLAMVAGAYTAADKHQREASGTIDDLRTTALCNAEQRRSVRTFRP